MSTSCGVKKLGESRSCASMVSSSRRTRYCACGLEVAKYTGNSVENHGREFLRCPIWNSPNTCNYFKWTNEEIMEDAVSMDLTEKLLVEAMKKNEKLKKKLVCSRKRASIWFFVAVVFWAITFFMCVKCGQKAMGNGCNELGN